jgi:hypothetical protein
VKRGSGRLFHPRRRQASPAGDVLLARFAAQDALALTWPPKPPIVKLLRKFDEWPGRGPVSIRLHPDDLAELNEWHRKDVDYESRLWAIWGGPPATPWTADVETICGAPVVSDPSVPRGEVVFA